MPQSYYPLEPNKLDAVRLDGLSRVARYRDETGAESQHVAYLNSDLLQTMLVADWLTQRGPLPADPTQAQIDAAILARQQAIQQAATDAAQLRQQILALAQSAVGVRVDQLTAAQVRALFAAVLWRDGALKPDMTVRPLADWIR